MTYVVVITSHLLSASKATIALKLYQAGNLLTLTMLHLLMRSITGQ